MLLISDSINILSHNHNENQNNIILSGQDNEANQWLFNNRRKRNMGEKLVGKKIKNFTFLKKLGEGSWATVYEAVDNKKNIVAIKVIPKQILKGSKKLNQLINTEISILDSCRNQNVIGFVCTFRTDNSIFIVTEYCNGGDLEIYLNKKKKKLSEDEATTFLKQILNGFKGLHEVKAMHRDFKAANVLLHNGICKIADFGFAKQLSKKQDMDKQTAQTILGTSLTMAPEVLSQKPYGFKADIWSIGVVYYQTLYGKYPYMARTDYDLLKKIKTTRPNFTGREISENARDFIDKCLTVDPSKRIDWKDIYEHPLIKDGDNQLIYGSSNRNIKQSIMQNKDFYLKTKLPEKNVEEEIEKAHSNRQIPFEEVKSLQNSPNMDQIIEEVYGIENKQQKFQNYLKEYTKKRNNIMFVDKFILPHIINLKKLKVNHELGLFIMSKKAYLDMKKFKIDIDRRTNVFNFPNTFQEFTETPAYKEMSYQVKIDLEKTYYQAKSHTENIGLCSNDINCELNVNKVISKDFNKLTNNIVNDYWRVLAQFIGSVRDTQKESLLKVLQALMYFKSTSKVQAEEFDQIMTNIDLQEAEKDLVSKYEKLFV